MGLRLLNDLLNFLPARSTEPWTELNQCLPHRSTVILVSGFAASRRNLSVLRKRLLRDGYNVLVLSMHWKSFPDSSKGIHYLAKKLSTLVLQAKKELGMENKIYLVAHSAGGLVARQYVQRLGGFYYCEGLITLATPHQGTWFALLGFFSHLVLKARVLWQMLPFSPFLRRLNAAEYPVGFRMVSIYSKDDVFCSPRMTRLPEHIEQSGEVAVVEMRHLHHGDFLLSKRVHRLLRSHLSSPSRAKVVA